MKVSHGEDVSGSNKRAKASAEDSASAAGISTEDSALAAGIKIKRMKVSHEEAGDSASHIKVKDGKKEWKWYSTCTSEEEACMHLKKGSYICIDMKPENTIFSERGGFVRYRAARIINIIHNTGKVKIHFQGKKDKDYDNVDLDNKDFFIFQREEFKEVKDWIARMRKD